MLLWKGRDVITGNFVLSGLMACHNNDEIIDRILLINPLVFPLYITKKFQENEQKYKFIINIPLLNSV